MGGDIGIDEGSVEQGIVLEAGAVMEPPTAEELLACLDLPEGVTLRWLRDHAFYTESACFSSWTINVGIDCTLFERQVTGRIKLGGQTMASVPRTGFAIRAQAASAALIDLGYLANGTIKPRIDLAVGGEATSVTSCTGMRAGEIHTALDAELDSPVLGRFAVAGGADWSRDPETGLAHLDFDLEASAEPLEGPPIAGSIVGAGIERFNKQESCPHTGTITFAGSIGADSGTTRLEYVGDGQVVIDLPDGRTAGPDTPLICR